MTRENLQDLTQNKSSSHQVFATQDSAPTRNPNGDLFSDFFCTCFVCLIVVVVFVICLCLSAPVLQVITRKSHVSSWLLKGGREI